MIRLMADALLAVWILGIVFTALMLYINLVGLRKMDAVAWVALIVTIGGLSFFWPISIYKARQAYEQSKRSS